MAVIFMQLLKRLSFFGPAVEDKSCSPSCPLSTPAISGSEGQSQHLETSASLSLYLIPSIMDIGAFEHSHDDFMQ
ncbi:unnamed protein product [Leuciscus chuanchicus]